jgi:5S rRNA maturation endonuclease (ribonuclease M5)
MDVREFVSYLRVTKGPTSSGEYLCKCPAHDDRTASLCIGTGADGRILVKCQAGCATQDVVKAMGLKMSDLYPEGSKPAASGKRKSASKPAPPPAPPVNGPIKQRPLGKLVKVYPYTDESGAVLFEVCRFEAEEDGQRVKTFRQRHKDPTNPNAKQGGYVWNITGVRSVIYRLPEVLAAIKEGRTVYLVEGEKDADTLAAAGFAATTNPGGASKSGASKWLPEHTKLLAGANVVILPDNDAAGQNDRKQVAAQLAAVAKSVKLLDLCKACPNLPKKGDITDMLELMGTAPGLKALRELESATDPVDNSEAQATAARDAAAALIGNLPGYCVDHGRICTWSDDTPKPLCTFTAITNGVVTRDNGVDEETWLLVDGWTANGEPLKQARVPAKAFKRMDWLTENWDIRATIMPGNTATDKVRFVIQQANALEARRIREYTHTGWRKIGGRWCFLYEGGAIGAEGVTVDLNRGLERYHMGRGFTPEQGKEIDALVDVMLLTEIIPRRISVPLMAFMFLAPLRDALLRANFPPTFSVYLIGGSGTHKSTLSALMLSFFGSFTESSLPASFNDTGNYIRSLAFSLKDMVLAVDDYHPEGNLQARRKMEDTAQQLSRAFGDLAQRGRMQSDQSLATAKPPRSLALISGEDMPNIRESGEARYYVVQVGKDDIKADKGLTEMQDHAASGAQAYVMRKYIEWLAPQMDELPTKLGERFKELRSMFQGAKLGHSRAPGTVAHLIIGYEMYMRFLIASGVVDDPDGELLRSEVNEAVKDIIANSAAQGRESRAERPSRLFLNTISEMLLTKEASVMDLTDSTGKATGGKLNIGYMDAVYYYLIPETSYRVVCEFFTKKGEAFPLSSRMLYKQMDEDGVIQSDNAGKRARVKTINGKSVRLLWVPRDCIDGPKPTKEQLRMDLNPGDPGEGFKEIPNDPDNPF